MSKLEKVKIKSSAQL